MVNELVCRFFSVNVLVELTVVMGTEPNTRLDGLRVTAAIPVPDRDTVCGLFDALSVMVSMPAGAAPRTEGVKVSSTVQLPPAATVGLKQVDEGSMAYGVPDVTASDEMLMLVDRLFMRVTVLIALVWPTTTLPKFTAVAESVTGAIPVPESVTVCGLFKALSVTVSVPAGAAPRVEGVKVRTTVQLAPAFKVGVRHVDEELIA
jgi:hypothetical protein